MGTDKFPLRIRTFLHVALLGLGLAGVYVSGYLIRHQVLQAQYDAVGKPMPFTLESALHYRRVKMLYDRGRLPEVDQGVQYPEGIRIRQIDAVSSEPVVAMLASLFPESVPFAERIRIIECGWFCLSIPLLAWAVRLWTGSWASGFLAASLVAVSISSVLRSTGQEISRENFAMPWLVGAFAAAAGYVRASVRRVPWLLAYCCFAALALIGWDMMQYLVGLTTLAMMIHVLCRKSSGWGSVATLYGLLILTVGMVGLLHPYYRYHGLVFSPLYVWQWAVLIAYLFREKIMETAGNAPPVTLAQKLGRNASFRLLLVMLVPPAALVLSGLTGSYGESYGHFGELLVAKIRFLNVKPDDPGLLTYYQRIMWVPSLHSATWELTKWLFPYSLLAAGAFGAVAWFISRQRPDPFIRYWLLVLVMSFAAYLLFVRFHVFVGLAAASICGWVCSPRAFPSRFSRIVVMILVASAAVAEGMHTVKERRNMGRPNVYYRELNELADWLKEHVAPEPVLANMGVSAFIATYGKCPIVMHPKFEDPSIRGRMEQYGNLLFGADEHALREWMETLGVEYFVYSKGEFAAEKPEYQMRYFVNRMHPPDHVPARRFERDDDSMRYFERLWGNRKYVVYRVLTSEREHRAETLAAEAEGHLQAGRLSLAEQTAVQAVGLDRHQEKALKVLRHAGSLIEQDFRYEPGEVAP